MENLHRGITLLLRSAITGEKLPLPEGFCLEEADSLVRAQSLTPMVYLGAYNCGISPKSELMLKYQQLYFQNLMRHQQQARAIDEIYRNFEENGIDYLPLKGCVMKPLYPNPEMRIMGDADILIRMEQYEKIKPAMEKLGYRENIKSAYDIHWVGKNLLAELHYLIFCENHGKFYQYFLDPWDRSEELTENRYRLTAEDNYLQIFIHMTKHFQHCGIGARQLVDVFVYRRAHPELDEEKVAQVLADFGLLEFHNHILRMLDSWFGDAPCDPVTDALTAYIFSGGNWGSTEVAMYTEALCFSGGDTKKAHGKSVFRTIFPELSYLQGSYNVLFDYPWLYPVFIVVRWVDVLLHRRKNIGRRLGVLQDMNQEKVTERKQFLDLIGLKFYEE